MIATDFIIREIEPKDNLSIAKVIRDVFVELDAPKIGTTFEDDALDDMYSVYQKPRSVFYVVEYHKQVVGGAGISELYNNEDNTCELQKMYFLPLARGLGLGTKMIHLCLEKAKEFGFNECYLETMSFMKDAQNLYRKNGFAYINNPKGNTCHYSCEIWMTKKL